MAQSASAVYNGLADPGPWSGFCAAIRKLCDRQALDRGFTAAFPDAVNLGALRGGPWSPSLK
ncbi:MAG: hypothetical protein M3Y33_00780 [Actinomycetota bacterium]|nr:hypothetical protein [Actinomycetota bacterium]